MDRTHPDVIEHKFPEKAVYLGYGRKHRRGLRFRGWIKMTPTRPWEYVGKRLLGDNPEWLYAVDITDRNAEKVLDEFGVFPYTHYSLNDLTATVPEDPRITLPADSAERKNYPLYRGLMRYFPAALAGVAKHSKEGNDKHNPGQELHHARGKSMDHEDCIMRHLMDLADLEERVATDELLHEADAIAWRALALSQELHEQYGGAPMAPGAEE